MANLDDKITAIITMPIVGMWVKIGEVKRTGSMFRGTYRRYAVMEFIEEDGMRRYKEVYMASDDSESPVLKSQSCELELKK